MLGEDHDANVRPGPTHLEGEVDALGRVGGRHADVEHHHVHLVLLEQPGQAGRVGGGGNDLQAWDRVEHRACALADQVVVLRDQQPGLVPVVHHASPAGVRRTSSNPGDPRESPWRARASVVVLPPLLQEAWRHGWDLGPDREPSCLRPTGWRGGRHGGRPPRHPSSRRPPAPSARMPRASQGCRVSAGPCRGIREAPPNRGLVLLRTPRVVDEDRTLQCASRW